MVLMLFWRCLLIYTHTKYILANIFLSSSCSKQDRIEAGEDLVRTSTSLNVKYRFQCSRLPQCGRGRRCENGSVDTRFFSLMKSLNTPLFENITVVGVEMSTSFS